MRKWLVVLIIAFTVVAGLPSNANAKTTYTADKHVQNIATDHSQINKNTEKQLNAKRVQTFLATQDNINFINDTLQGRGWDFDNFAGYQCINKTEKAHKVVHNYDTRSGQMYFIRSFR